MARWDPWRGCHRYSEGCKFCYIHKGDAKRGVDTNCITKTDKFNAPIVRKKSGEYKMNSGLIYVCISSQISISGSWKRNNPKTKISDTWLTKPSIAYLLLLHRVWLLPYISNLSYCLIGSCTKAVPLNLWFMILNFNCPTHCVFNLT